MKTKLILGLGCGVALVALAIVVATRTQNALVAGLPPFTKYASKDDARKAADAFKEANGGVVVSVLGTGSMAPYIPAAPAGADPMATVVAFVVTDPKRGFPDIQVGTLCLYRPKWAPGQNVMHQAAQKDSEGWIMTGLHNKNFESNTRVTPANFVGTVAHTFTF